MNNLPLSPELVDTFRTLSIKKRQGVLEIISPSREYELTFFEGKIIHADQVDRSFIQFLAERVKLDPKLSNELESVGRGEQITRLLQLTDMQLSKLIELKKSYDRQTLFNLAAEDSFAFDFRTKIVRCPEGLSLELSPGHYLLDLLEELESAEEGGGRSAPPVQTVIEPVDVRPQQVPRPAVVDTEVVTPVRKKSRRTKRRPPKAGRFKVAPPSTKKKLLEMTKLNADQTVLGIKLTLILLLSLFAPNFLSDWSQALYTFLGL